MKDKLQKYALIAEITGGLGIIITLIVLVFEVRANSELTRTLAFQQEIRSLNEWRNNIASDANQLRIYSEWFQGAEIPEGGTPDGFVLAFIIVGQLSIYESGYYSRTAGILGDSEWDRIERSACGTYRQVTRRDGYWDLISIRLTNEFAQYLQASC